MFSATISVHVLRGLCYAIARSFEYLIQFCTNRDCPIRWSPVHEANKLKYLGRVEMKYNINSWAKNIYFSLLPLFNHLLFHQHIIRWLFSQWRWMWLRHAQETVHDVVLARELHDATHESGTRACSPIVCRISQCSNASSPPFSEYATTPLQSKPGCNLSGSIPTRPPYSSPCFTIIHEQHDHSHTTLLFYEHTA